MSCADIPGTFRPGRPSATEDIDEIAVERACRGERLPLNVAEREMAVQRCIDQLWLSNRETAARLGLADRTVVRINRRLRDRMGESV